MIFHDSATVAMQVPFDPPQYDGLGNEIFDHVEATVPAEVFPLDTDAVLGATNIVTSRYRMILAPQVDIPAKIGNMMRVGWGAFGLDPANPFGVTSGLRVDGTVERHMLRGRLHLRTDHKERHGLKALSHRLFITYEREPARINGKRWQLRKDQTR